MPGFLQIALAFAGVSDPAAPPIEVGVGPVKDTFPPGRDVVLDGNKVGYAWEAGMVGTMLHSGRAVGLRIDRNNDGDRSSEHFVLVFACARDVAMDRFWVHDPAFPDDAGTAVNFSRIITRRYPSGTPTHFYVTSSLV